MWVACADDLPPRAECTTVSVPVDHADPTGPRRELAVRRLRASRPARGQLWYVDGGPGDSGTADLANLAGVAKLVPDLDLVSFDPRGVGGSGRLSCPAEESPESVDGREIVGAEWATCLQRVRTLPALATHTTAQTAADLADALDALGEGTVVLWGVSYGTFLVQRLLVDRPDAADAVVLDGLTPPTWSFDRFDAGLDAQARRWLGEACLQDPVCAAHLGPDPVAFALDAVASLEAGPCGRIGLDAPTARLLAGAMFQAGGDLATQMPAALYRLKRCERRDRRALVHLFGVLFPDAGGGLEEKASHSQVLQRQIAYADLWDPAADPQALQAFPATSVATTAVSARFSELAASWPRSPADPEAGRFAAPTVPVLLMHGGYDAALPLEVARAYADAWPDATWAPFPTAAHVAFNAGPCPQGVFAAFVGDPAAPTDAGCAADMSAPSFAADATADRRLWGTPDRWGDR